MKRFLVFAGDTYYPIGGWSDFHGDYDTLEEAEASIGFRVGDWAHVVDTNCGDSADTSVIVVVKWAK